MMFHTCLGTQFGVYRLDGEDLTCLGLEDHESWAIYAFNKTDDPVGIKDTVLAGSYGEGIFRSTDGGDTWASANGGLTATALRTFIADPARAGAIICGAEPGLGFRSTDGGQT